jgi:hypothetical protein
MSARTYAERAAEVEPIAAALERIAHRLRQGAISSESAAAKLAELAVQLDVKPALTATIAKRERSANSFTTRGWSGGVSYEWVAELFRNGEPNGRKTTRTRKELIEWCATLGYEVQS